jgi:hypothetical protein
MRFDPREKEAARRKAEQDELMREAEAALAITNEVLKTRKDALIAKHLNRDEDARESIHELDFIFDEKKPRAPASNNYLDDADEEQKDRERMAEFKRRREALEIEKKAE